MTQSQIEYDVYRQEWEESGVEVLYDEDERPMCVRHREIGEPLSFREWLPSQLSWAIEVEDYMYAAEIRDLIAKVG